MSVILHALLIDVPDELQTERLVLRATRPGQGPLVNQAVLESFPELWVWMPWSQQAQSLGDSEKHCREAHAKWHSREMLDFCFFQRSDGALVGKGGLHTIDWSIPKFEKSGFVLEGILRQSRRDTSGELADSCMYARTF